MLVLFRLARFRNTYLIRGLLVWALTRAGLAMGSGQLVPLDLAVPAEIGILGVVAAAVLIDARRRDEDLFLANLGVPTFAIVAFAIPLAALAECLVP